VLIFLYFLQERDIRKNLYERLRYTFNLLPSSEPRYNYPGEYERALCAAFEAMGTLFALDLLKRKVEHLRSYNWSSLGTNLLHELFSYAVKYPSSASRIESIINDHIVSYASYGRKFVSDRSCSFRFH
jgi:hypothetical protein